MTSLRTFATCLFVAGAFAALTPAAFAATPDVPVSAGSEATQVAVNFADLDLSTAAGQAKLKGRLSRAATEACVDAGAGNGPVSDTVAVMRCRASALSRANGELASRNLAHQLAMH